MPKINTIILEIRYLDRNNKLIQRDAGAVSTKDGIGSLDQLFSKARAEVEKKLGTS